ncbi:hypothetical protein AB6A40_009718 [Gnathostoma spinigerum]|uniref:Cytochrome P450 n=1 Tax=Gnathostoma spinigerum TaxID=75299 RepID=A0ABD6ESQ8_9BILA
MHVTLELMERTSPLTFLPWLRFCPPDGFGYWKMKKEAENVHNMMMKEINDRLSTKDYRNEKRNDFTSAFLRKIEESESEGDRQSCFTIDMLAKMMIELHFAGIQTECHTFAWEFLFLIHHSAVQEKCRDEILRNVCFKP